MLNGDIDAKPRYIFYTGLSATPPVLPFSQQDIRDQTKRDSRRRRPEAQARKCRHESKPLIQIFHRFLL